MRSAGLGSEGPQSEGMRGPFQLPSHTQKQSKLTFCHGPPSHLLNPHPRPDSCNRWYWVRSRVWFHWTLLWNPSCTGFVSLYCLCSLLSLNPGTPTVLCLASSSEKQTKADSRIIFVLYHIIFHILFKQLEPWTYKLTLYKVPNQWPIVDVEILLIESLQIYHAKIWIMKFMSKFMGTNQELRRAFKPCRITARE